MKFFKFFLYVLPLNFLQMSIVSEEKQYEQFFDEDEDYVKVAIAEDKAYWVFNNTLYEAEIIDDEIVREYARPVDAFDMKYEDVTKLMQILDEIEDWEE